MLTPPRNSLLLAAALWPLLAGTGSAAEHDQGAMTHDHAATTSGDEHAHHHAMMTDAATPALKISSQHYHFPDKLLSDERGRSVRLAEVLSDQSPVVLNFIYTTCTTICPVLTATQLQLQKRLAGSPKAPRFVSISVDPDYDSALVLQKYARRFGADWSFLTGSRADVLEVLASFDAWRGSKANHAALTLMRKAGSMQWTRVEGLASAQQLASTWNAIAD